MPKHETVDAPHRQPATAAALTVEAEYLRGDISYQEYIAQIRQLPGYGQQPKPRQDDRQR